MNGIIRLRRSGFKDLNVRAVVGLEGLADVRVARAVLADDEPVAASGHNDSFKATIT